MPQNGGNRVSEDLKFQNYPGEDVPGPPFIEPPLLKKNLDPPQQGMFTAVVYFDLKKAFDTLNNKILLLCVPQRSILGPLMSQSNSRLLLVRLTVVQLFALVLLDFVR